MKPPLTWLKMTPSTFSPFSNACSSLTQLSSRLSLVARDDRFAERVFDPLEIDLDLVADARRRVAAVIGEFLQRDAALGLQTDVDQRHILLDGDDAALDHRTLERLVGAVGLIQKGCEILARRRGGGSYGHCLS